MQQPEADARAWGGARSAESNHHVPACRLNPSNLADAAPNATGPSSKTCLCDNTAKPVPHAPARDTDRAVGTPVRGAPRPRRKVVIAATAVPSIPRLRAPLPTVRPASKWANPRQFWNVHALWPIPPQTKAELTSSLLDSVSCRVRGVKLLTPLRLSQSYPNRERRERLRGGQAFDPPDSTRA